MQYPVVKLDREEIAKTNFKTKNPTIFEIHSDAVKFEFLICYKTRDKALICGSGNAHREKHPLPIFQRNSWIPDFQYTTIFYADPTLYLCDLTLTWYYGTKQRWYLEEIAGLLKRILDRLGIPLRNTVNFGSSGGGYSSIVMATMLGSKATVINPQCNIVNYDKYYFKKLKGQISPNDEMLSSRTNVIEVMKTYQFMPYIHYIQNVKCERDLTDQLYPFLKELDENDFFCNEKLFVDFYADFGGHNAMPSKQYCIKAIEEDMEKHVETLYSSLILFTSYINGMGIRVATQVQNDVLSIDLIPERNPEAFRYAYYLVDAKDDYIIKIGYSERRHCEFKLPEKGIYRVLYFMKDAQGQKFSFLTDFIDCREA